MKTAWLKDSGIIMDGGAVVLCDWCPCGEEPPEGERYWYCMEDPRYWYCLDNDNTDTGTGTGT